MSVNTTASPGEWTTSGLTEQNLTLVIVLSVIGGILLAIVGVSCYRRWASHAKYYSLIPREYYPIEGAINISNSRR
jgi:hypothetical protein